MTMSIEIFMLYLLQRCGFGEKLCGWIQFCLAIVRFSIIVNDTYKGFFASGRDFRQGDPLSSSLLVLIMEAFSWLMVRVELGGLNISHVLFVDDTLMLCDVEVNWLPHLRCILLCFEANSGLRINLAMSTSFIW